MAMRKNKFTQEGYRREVIDDCMISGGLQKHTQRIQAYFYPRTSSMCAKVSITQGMYSKEERGYREQPQSLRFSEEDYWELDRYIDLLIAAKIRLGKSKGIINPHNVNNHIHKEYKKLCLQYRGSKKEVSLL